MKKFPLVSVIIPTFNHGKYLDKALNSVLNQTYTNFEIIVIDNNSDDNTDDIVKKFNDKRIQFIKINNKGIIAASRNKGIKISRGEWISFLDSDDWWKKEKLEVCVNHINSEVDFIYHDLEKIPNDNIIYRIFNKKKKLKEPILKNLLIKGNTIYNSSVILRKKIILKVNYIDENPNLIAGEDYNTWKII